MSLADDFDALLAGPDSVSFYEVAGLVNRFSARFGAGDGVSMTLEAYPDTVAAGTALWDEQEGGLDSPNDVDQDRIHWLDLCARAGTDPEAGAGVAETFSQSHRV